MDLHFPQQYVAVLNLVLIAIIVYFMALAVSNGVKLHLAPSEVAEILQSSAPRQSPRKVFGPRPRAYYDIIAQRDIFSRSPMLAAPLPILNENLDVTLIGTSHLSAGKPFVIVETTDGEQALYRLGETIPNVGRVLSISRNQAIVLHNGHRVALQIPNPGEGEAPGPTPFGVPSRRFRGPRNFPRGRVGMPFGSHSRPPSNTGVSRLASNRYVIGRATVDGNLSEIGSLLAQIRAVPNMENGSANGFRLSQIQPGSIFQQIGLENGDVITEAQGQQITDPMRAMSLVSALRNSPSISLSLIRNGSPLQMHYTIH
jgi:type II secretion system protein C